MLYLPNSKIVDSGEVAVAPGAAIEAEGQVLVRQVGNTAAGVGPSTGVAGEVFAGFALVGVSGAPFLESYATKVERFVVPAGGNIKLSLAPVAGQFSVMDITAGVVDTDAALSGKTISGLTAGNEVSVSYKYEMTVTQARARMGDAQPGGYAGLDVGSTGVAKRGTIYIDQFDASVDWSSVDKIRCGASGQLVASGSGPVLNAVVTHLPTADVPFLGIEFSV